MTVQDVREYLRVDSSYEDLEIEAQIKAAQEYIYSQTGKTRYKTGLDNLGAPIYVAIAESPLYGMAVKNLCAHWYENRGVEMLGAFIKSPISVEAIVMQIAISSDYV